LSLGGWAGSIKAVDRACGTVQVDATISGTGPTTLSAPITVNNRDWHIDPAWTADPVSNGTFYQLPVPPQNTGIDAGLGEYQEVSNYSGSETQTINDDGPNRGYTYFTKSILFTTGNKVFQYEINPDLQNSSSDFSAHQCELDGYISWQHLYDGTLRHEFNSSTDSHYAQYKQAWNANNGGDFVEQQVAVPGQNVSDWLNSVGSTLNGYYGKSGTIATSTAVEPSPVNEVNGQDLYINYKILGTGTYPHSCP
jgi:hypothetical protein